VLERALQRLGTPGFSEANLYDALLGTLNRVRAAGGDRKAVIVISSGLDTFSKATQDQVFQSARDSGIPIYTIGLVRIIQRESAVYGTTAPFARVDWSGAEKFLENLAKVSGGRAYVLESDLTVAAVYDDIMENLRLRYVVTYVSSNPATSGPPRKVRVELVDPKTGQALKIRDSSGKLSPRKSLSRRVTALTMLWAASHRPAQRNELVGRSFHVVRKRFSPKRATGLPVLSAC